MNIRMARRCLNNGCQEAIQCPEGRCALHSAMHAPATRNEGPEEPVAPKVSEKDINRWQAAIQERPEGPWTLGCGGSFDRTTINPISDEMLAELAQWLRMGYTPWNGRSMPLSPGDRQFMFMLYYSVQGLIARMRAAEKLAAPTDSQAGRDALDARADLMQKALEQIVAIENEGYGEDWCEIDNARGIARAALTAAGRGA